LRFVVTALHLACRSGREFTLMKTAQRLDRLGSSEDAGCRGGLK
jgi:hypothetical protein